MQNTISWQQRIFVNPNIFNLFIGQIISQTGDSMYRIALLWLLLELTGSNAETGLIAMAGYLPALLFGLFSGVLVDRIERKWLMRLADVSRFLLVLLIPLLYYVGVLTPFLLGLITFLVASFNTIFLPARDAIVGQLVTSDERFTANSLIQTSWQYAAFFGPAIAVGLLVFVGEIQLFTLDALTYLISFFFISRIVVEKKNEASAEKTADFSTAWADVVAGLRFVKDDQRLLTLLIITATNNLFLMGPAVIGTPIFVREILGLGADSYAFVQIAYAIGMIVATYLLNRFAQNWRKSQIIVWGMMLDGLTFVPLLFITTFTGMFIATAIHALALPMIIISRPTLLQAIVPEAMQGRVFSIFSVAVVGCTAVSIALTGALAEIIPINVLFALFGTLAASVGLAGWLIKDFRSLAI